MPDENYPKRAVGFPPPSLPPPLNMSVKEASFLGIRPSASLSRIGKVIAVNLPQNRIDEKSGLFFFPSLLAADWKS